MVVWLLGLLYTSFSPYFTFPSKRSSYSKVFYSNFLTLIATPLINSFLWVFVIIQLIWMRDERGERGLMIICNIEFLSCFQKKIFFSSRQDRASSASACILGDGRIKWSSANLFFYFYFFSFYSFFSFLFGICG